MLSDSVSQYLAWTLLSIFVGLDSHFQCLFWIINSQFQTLFHSVIPLITDSTPTLDVGASTQAIRDLVEKAARLLPTQGPIEVFVYRNTLQAFEDQSFHDGVKAGAERYHANAYLPETEYRRIVELLSIVVFWKFELGGGFLLEDAVLEGTSFDDVDDLLVTS